MLTVLRDRSGHLQLACEWWRVNQAGEQDWTATGTWVRVEQVEVSKGAPGRYWIRELIAHIAFLAPDAVGAFWERRDKRGQKRVHYFYRRRLLSRVEYEHHVNYA